MKPDVAAIESAWQKLEPPPRGRGRVDLVVVRVGGGEHRTPERVAISVDGGVEGDRWDVAKDPDRHCQVTLMMTRVARLLVGDKPLHLPGDNFLVDLEIGEEALPAGARIALGAAVLEVSGEPHLGCGTFRERFGAAALRWVNHTDVRSRRARGVNCRVIEGGEVAVGDVVEVL